MLGFWIWFYLGVLYVSVILGDVYVFINLFVFLLWIVVCCFFVLECGCYCYFEYFVLWFVLGGYIVFIVLELFGVGCFWDVGLFFVVYVVYVLIGVFCFGCECWFVYGDMFGVLCRLCVKLLLLKWCWVVCCYVIVELRNLVVDMLCDGLVDISVIVFLLFMLLLMVYDGLCDMVMWYVFFWCSIYLYVVDLFLLFGWYYVFLVDILLIW